MVSVDADAVLADLDELARLTGDERGAQRVAWTGRWEDARSWFRERASSLPVTEHLDPAGNQWLTLAGASPRSLVIGSHLDSVPDGGRLDGALGVLAGLAVLRRVAAEGTPACTVRVVSWADEEGARFGGSLFGSSAAAGTLDLKVARAWRDAEGHAVADVVAEHGVVLEHMPEARTELTGIGAYLELHIEQGPVLEEQGLALGVVEGTFGVERRLLRFRGQSAHAGSTPMRRRRDALLAAARVALRVRDVAIAEGGVGTTGRLGTSPGIPTAVPGEVEMTLDLRHLDPRALARMLAAAESAASAMAAEEGCSVAVEPVWHIRPVHFDPALRAFADQAVAEVQGRSFRLPSGPLHDAAEMARAGIPTAMLFCQSLRGLSHTREEDTRPEHLAMAVRALDSLARRTLDWIAAHP
ncbi:MAG: Zn-dependent hydrolase [Candidatus Dormibacteraeota bacterium]|nr:Zn-dependent hydrolase [Candidatus Dormibacteraeota bacterium]